MLGVDLRRGARRVDGDVLAPPGPLDRRGMTVSPACAAQVVEQRQAAEELEALAVDRDDRVARLEAGRGRRRTRLDRAERATPTSGVAEPGDAGEDRRTPGAGSSARRRRGSRAWSGGSARRTSAGRSRASPSSPSSLTNPPIGSQLSVYSVSPFERRTLARGGNPMPNSRTRTFASRAVTKCPSSWMITSTPEDQDEQDDRDDRLEEAGHAPAPTGPRAKAARTAASSSTRASTSGLGVAVPPEARPRRPRAAPGCR